jgi:hypothetical protein
MPGPQQLCLDLAESQSSNQMRCSLQTPRRLGSSVPGVTKQALGVGFRLPTVQIAAWEAAFKQALTNIFHLKIVALLLVQ